MITVKSVSLEQVKCSHKNGDLITSCHLNIPISWRSIVVLLVIISVADLVK